MAVTEWRTVNKKDYKSWKYHPLTACFLIVLHQFKWGMKCVINFMQLTVLQLYHYSILSIYYQSVMPPPIATVSFGFTMSAALSFLLKTLKQPLSFSTYCMHFNICAHPVDTVHSQEPNRYHRYNILAY